jgi:opacity protein-like surface antigen
MTDFMTEFAPDYLYNKAFRLGLIDNEGSLFALDPETGKFQDIDNQIRYSENGSIGEWNFSYGVNISNRFFLGISLGFVDLDYRLDVMYDEQSIENPRDRWHLDNYYEASGAGFNLKLGAIASVTDFMRIGVAFHTPTFYNIDEYIRDEIVYRGNALDTRTFANSDLQTPLRLQGSLGFIIEKTALIGLEYQFENFSAMRFSSRGILDQSAKDIINSEMRVAHTVKAGAEVNVVEGFFLRAGIAFVSSPSIKLKERVYADPANFQAYPLAQPQTSLYYTGGIGYKIDYFYADLAYVHQLRKEKFFEYLPQSAGPYDLSLHNNNIMLTLGCRF